MRRVILFVGLVAGAACAESAQLGAAASYEAQQMACVDNHSGDRAAIDACRNDVKRAWAKDAGQDASEGGPS